MRILATGLHSVQSTVHILLNKGDANRRKCRFLVSSLAPGLAVEDHACLIEFTNAKNTDCSCRGLSHIQRLHLATCLSQSKKAAINMKKLV